MSKKRLLYLDNLKVCLTVLVIFHHTGQAYGDGGDSCQYWYYANSDPDIKTKFYIYFDRKGKKYTLEERYADKKCYLYEIDDVEVIPTWSLVNDSVIEMGGLNRKLTIVNDTFLIITTDKFHWVDTLYKVTDPHLLKKLREVPIP